MSSPPLPPDPRLGAAPARGRRLKARTDGPGGSPRITPAERRVLERLLTAERPVDIAVALGVHVGTVWSHITNLRAKFGARDIADLLQRAATAADTASPAPVRTAPPTDGESQ